LREDRRALEAKAGKLKEDEQRLEDHLIGNLSKENAEGVSGKRAKVGIYVKRIAQPKDWDKFYAFILKTQDFSLLNRAVGQAAVKERWEAGEEVPGIDVYNKVCVSLTKKG